MKLDGREKVIAVKIGGSARAYPSAHLLSSRYQRCGGQSRHRGHLLNALSHRSGVGQRDSGTAADVSPGRHQ